MALKKARLSLKGVQKSSPRGALSVDEQTVFALVPGPVLEGIGELVSGTIRLFGPELTSGAKAAPFSVLQKIFGKPKSDPDLDEDQIKEDGKHVIKVSVAIKIVKDSLDGFSGTTSEFLDTIRKALPVDSQDPNFSPVANISHTIAEKFREKALSQASKRTYEVKTVYTRKP